MKKKYTSILLVLALCFTMTACGEKQSSLPNETPTGNTEVIISEEHNSKEETNQESLAIPDEDKETELPAVETSSEDEGEKTENNKTSNTVEVDLNLTQKNSIAMLNYLAVVSQEIASRKDNRVYLEEVYTSLFNNINPEKIDQRTLDHITNLSDIIENYRMIDIKRERLTFLYNQDKAATMRNAMPNPIAILSVASSLDWKRLAVAVAYTAMDSINSYKKANDALDKQFMLDGWNLDDEEAENIHKNRKRAFNYMVNIVRDNNLPGHLALSENEVKDFVDVCSSDSVYDKLQFLEDKENVYGAFGYYWLELSMCYYEISDYENCLECISKYNNLYTGIFRKDYEYAKVLPQVIIAAQNYYSGKEYIDKIETFTNSLKDNVEDHDWALKFFAAQSYLDLYTKTNDESYLKEAYQISLNNVRQLKDEQISINDTYLGEFKPLELEDLPKNLTGDKLKEAEEERKKEQKKLDAYNKSLKEARKKELLSLYEPLIINCDLLFGLAKKLNITESEKTRIEGILKTNTRGVFVADPLNDKYSFSHNTISDFDIDIDKDKIIIPANLLVNGATLSVTIHSNGTTKTFDDWKIKKVDRKDEDLSSFQAYFESKQYKDNKWNLDDRVEVKILYEDLCDSISTNYKVVKFSGNWLLPDSVIFDKQ